MADTPSTSNPLAPTSLYPCITSTVEEISQNDDLHRKSQNDTKTLDEALDIVHHQLRQMFIMCREVDGSAQNSPIPAGAPPLPGEEDEANTPTESINSKCQRQLEFLQNRHEEFKKAAVRAGDNGNKQEAMRFMKTMKAIQDMIDHTRNGLPCDIR